MKFRYIFFILNLLAIVLSGNSTSILYADQLANPQLNKNSNGPTAKFSAMPNQNGMSESFDDLAASVTQPTWNIECVDCPKKIEVSDRFLRLDSLGHPRLAYGGSQLYYAWEDGFTWHNTIVDHDSLVGAVSLALDLHDDPRISYSTHGQLKYAEWISNTWNIQVVDSNVVGSFTSLALDRVGQPSIAYYDSVNNDLKYAHQSEGGWITQTVDSAGWVGAFPSLALDSADQPHIAYTDFGPLGKSGSALKYAFWTKNSWNIQTIEDNNSSMGTYTSLVLDANDRPHISFHDESFDKLKYAYWNGTRWDIQIVNPFGKGGWFTSLALDADGHPHITYMDHVSLTLEYAYWADDIWHLQTVDTGFVGRGSSLVLDNVGQPHVGYLDVWNQELKYSYWTGATWEPHTVDIAGDAGLSHSLVLDPAGNPHISYYDSAKYNLNYAYRTGDHWNIQAVDTVGFVGQGNSLALDATNRPHITYGANNSLKYASWTGDQWNFETVDSGECGHSSLILDEDGDAHISYACGRWPNVTVKYAYWTGSAWDIQPIDQVIDLPANTFLLLDSAGNPHVSYSADVQNDSPLILKYAYWTGSLWNIQTIDSANIFAAVSLALDSADSPSISYANQGLKYAVWTGSGWDIQTLDSEGNGRFSSSLRLDENDNPRISYNGNKDELRYARWSDGHWDIQTVDSKSGVLSTALALDSRQVPFISYYDSGTGALKFTQLILPPLLLDSTVSPSDKVQTGDVLTYTLTISAPAVSTHLWNPLPPNVEYITNSLISTLTPTVLYSPTARAIVWQGLVPTDTVSLVRFQVTPTISATVGQSLAPVIVNTAWLTDSEYRRSVSATTIVNGWHVYLPVLMQ